MSKQMRRFWLSVAVLAISAAGLMYQSVGIHASSGPLQVITAQMQRSAYRRTLADLSPKLRALTDEQTSNSIEVVSDQVVQERVTSIRVHIMRSNFDEARTELRSLKADLGGWKNQLEKKVAEQKTAQAAATAIKLAPPAPAKVTVAGKVLPILMYHYTPNDFESQLQYIQSHGYTTVTMDDAVAFINGTRTLPAKSVVITFDDGYADQMNAYALLAKYQMKATFYIITGGEASKWCIGVDRHWDQGYGCGDSYLTWGQIAQLEQSGLIEIAAHTVDHLNLAQQSAEVQRAEMLNSKLTLEDHLGHPIRHFAYPYGSYNATTVSLARSIGFSSAVTTLPGTIQSVSKLYTLYRITNVKSLP